MSQAASKSAVDRARNWLVARYMADPVKLSGGPIPTTAVFVRRGDFLNFLCAIGADVAETEQACIRAGWIAECVSVNTLRLFPEGEEPILGRAMLRYGAVLNTPTGMLEVRHEVLNDPTPRRARGPRAPLAGPAVSNLTPRCGGRLQCTEDFAVVVRKGVSYHLGSSTRRSIVAHLVGEWEAGRKDVRKETLLDYTGDASCVRLVDAFRSNGVPIPAWKLIRESTHPRQPGAKVKKRRGWYTLNI